MGTTVIYHKKSGIQDDHERARMERDFQVVTARKKPRTRFVSFSDKWNRLVEAIAAAASFSARRDRATEKEKEED